MLAARASAPQSGCHATMQRILFVEDDPEIGQLISSWLARHDMEVLLEPRGDLALARVEAEQPDLVLLDIMLPGQDGPPCAGICARALPAPSSCSPRSTAT